ncbi:hypothetical protein [Propioniciclava soli]|uniref:LapA family protein n=1 Tax=Propioniciclava soli TaxID=2775081 RepID=A0ABZ3CCV5_9ACTN|nr:hypothetical protein [Propioniciclava soli]
MKILKVLLAVLGVAGLVAAGVLLARFALDSRELIGAAQRYTGNVIPDPFMTTAMLTGIGAATGLALGLAIGLPNRTSGQIRRATLDEVNTRRTTEIGNRAASHTSVPVSEQGPSELPPGEVPPPAPRAR